MGKRRISMATIVVAMKLSWGGPTSSPAHYSAIYLSLDPVELYLHKIIC